MYSGCITVWQAVPQNSTDSIQWTALKLPTASTTTPTSDSRPNMASARRVCGLLKSTTGSGGSFSPRASRFLARQTPIGMSRTPTTTTSGSIR